MKSKDILREVENIFNTRWSAREGRQVPEAEDVRLGNDAVLIEGAVLYADMADSTGLVNSFEDSFAAEIYKSYLISACRIIRYNGGEITGFNGDRVMAVFLGDKKTTSAAKTALKINFIIKEINGLIKSSYKDADFQLNQKIGVDTGKFFVARTGIRNSNDLIWVGPAANYAAKLCALGDANYPTHITEDVFSALAEEARFGGSPRREMWEMIKWTEGGIIIYRSNWWWSF